MGQVKVLVCRPGKDPTIEEVEDRFDQWQKLVKGDDQVLGHVEVVHLHDGVFLVCNEDGELECEFNREVPGVAPEIPAGAVVISQVENAAAPGTMGVHRVFGTFALGRRTRSSKGGLGITSLNPEDVDRWSGALKWMAT